MAKKVLVVDDSVVVRSHLSKLISQKGHLVDTAINGKEALEKATNTNYDAITMDVNMPVMDGLAAVKAIMQENPTPIIMLSAFTSQDADTTLDALNLGAIAAIEKTSTMHLGDLDKQHSILKALEAAFLVSKDKLKLGILRKSQTSSSSSDVSPTTATSIVLIGSSTGGPKLIEEICYLLPQDYPHAVCITQHMPESFLERFAQRLNDNSKLPVIISADNMEVNASKIYVARGATNLKFVKQGSKIIFKHGEARIKSFFVPSVNEMYFSALESFNPHRIMAVQLTGIGDDGADGMVALKKAGAFTVAESEETATVFGMPKEAAARGGTREVLPFPKILQRILNYEC